MAACRYQEAAPSQQKSVRQQMPGNAAQQLRTWFKEDL